MSTPIHSLIPETQASSSTSFQTPIVLVVFNRPTLTETVFRRVAEVRPAHLLLIADGPRSDRPGEELLCEQVRSIVTAVDWPCQVEINFSDRNLGCRNRLISGLTWVFEQVEEAIILEDDVLPDLSFFRFCEEMLARYRGDDRISMVGGFSIAQDHVNISESYYFSQLSHIWGWATWRRSWARYDEHLENWPSIKASGLLREVFTSSGHRAYWTMIFDQMYAGTGPNTWDYQWFYTNVVNSALSVIPRLNLIQNIGFGPDATHTIHAQNAPILEVNSMPFPLIHPPTMIPLRSIDLVDQDLSECRIPTFLGRVVSKLRQSISYVGID